MISKGINIKTIRKEGSYEENRPIDHLYHINEIKINSRNIFINLRKSIELACLQYFAHLALKEYLI